MKDKASAKIRRVALKLWYKSNAIPNPEARSVDIMGFLLKEQTTQYQESQNYKQFKKQVKAPELFFPQRANQNPLHLLISSNTDQVANQEWQQRMTR